MAYYHSITETVGNTPLIKLNKLAKDIKATVLVKVEYFNPGHSVKDRIALRMVTDAEKEGKLKPGGTIIEGTSGNTGMGLAMIAATRGYKCIFVTNDKQSQEKINILKAMGAEVVICPTNVPYNDPRSYASTAKRINRETANSFYFDQYNNLSNSAAHYSTTGPEIWEQSEGKITHLAAGVGTGGTLCGVAKFLKEKNKKIKTLGIDTYGSIFKKYKDTGEVDENEIYPYLTEGIGEDFLPANLDFSLVDDFIKVTDKDAAITARRLAREEGLLIGWSCGAAVHGALEYARTHLKEDDMLVIVLPDHGTRYLNKIYNDEWMKFHGFLEEREFATAKDIIKKNKNKGLFTVSKDDKVEVAIKIMSDTGYSQIPVADGEHIVGSIIESKVLHKILESPEITSRPISEIMDKPFIFVGLDNTIDVLASLINKDNKALLVRDEHKNIHIITQADLLYAMRTNTAN